MPAPTPRLRPRPAVFWQLTPANACRECISLLCVVLCCSVLLCVLDCWCWNVLVCVSILFYHWGSHANTGTSMPSNSYDSAGQQENGNGNDHHAICLAADKTTIPSQPTPSPMVRDAGGKLDTDGGNTDMLTGSISGDSSGADSDDSRSDLDGNPAHSPSCPRYISYGAAPFATTKLPRCTGIQGWKVWQKKKMVR